MKHRPRKQLLKYFASLLKRLSRILEGYIDVRILIAAGLMFALRSQVALDLSRIIISLGLIALPLIFTKTLNFESSPPKWISFLLMAEAVAEWNLNSYSVFLAFWIVLNRTRQRGKQY